VYHPLPQDDPKRRNPDLSYTQEILQWEPKISLEKGVKTMLESLFTLSSVEE
jgi:nucleoside-diphosphate-sugar epimerase